MRTLRTTIACALSLIVGTAAATAHADPELTPLTNRDFTLDLARPSVLASYRITGMGGASLGVAEGAGFMTGNPAAVASRASTTTDWFDWDILFDKYEPGLGDDTDNNGLKDSGGGVTRSGALGGMLYFGRLGVGFTVTNDAHDDIGAQDNLSIETTITRVHLGWAFGKEGDFVAGLTLDMGSLQLTDEDRDVRLVDERGYGVTAGMLWRPQRTSMRFGARVSSPLSAPVEETGCDPFDCDGLILPERVAVPWSLGAGLALRIGPTPWNIPFPERFRDERSITVAADVIMFGRVNNGANFESFIRGQRQESGDQPSASLRGGVEIEVVPAWFRLRGGVYNEPSRVKGVDNRIHGTAGLDLRFFSFSIGDREYRLRASAAVDAASEYLNVVLSLGFWH